VCVCVCVCVCLTECDLKRPGPLGVAALRKRISQSKKILAGKRKEKKLLGSNRGWKLNIKGHMK